MTRYIGDSVYVEWDGHGLWLTTRTGLPTDPSNRIYLEPEVYAQLVDFVAEIKASIAEGRAAEAAGGE